MGTNTNIPFYTRIGGRITLVLILLLTIMLLKNCGASFYYGMATGQQEIEKYYRLGYEAGSRQAGGESRGDEPDLENPLLMKSYRRGFRDGWDHRRRSKSNDTVSPPHPD